MGAGNGTAELMPKLVLELLDGHCDGRVRALGAHGQVLLLCGTLEQATLAATDAGVKPGDLVRANWNGNSATWRFKNRRETMTVSRAA